MYESQCIKNMTRRSMGKTKMKNDHILRPCFVILSIVERNRLARCITGL